MEALFLKLLNMSITSSWLVLAVIAVRLVFKKTPKWILCLLWGLVAIRLICPFSIESRLSLIPDTEPVSRNAVYTSETVKQARGDILDADGNVLVERHPQAARGEILDSEGNVILEKKDGVTFYHEVPQTRTWISYLSKIWIVGICGMLLYTIASYYLLKRKVATAIPVKRDIKQSEYVDSPFVLGIIRPVIYLPFDMAEGDMTYVIAHEKAHIRRRDHWWKPLGFLLLSVYWFNPLLWLAYILLCRDIEAACDEKVIRDMDKENRRAYSTALLNCSIHRRRIAACPLAFGEVGVKARVKGVMNYKKPAFWLILIGLLLVVIVSVCFLTNPDNALPITMRVDFVSRTRADLKFHYDDGLTEGEYQISDAYSLEVLEQGNWYEIGNLSDEETSGQVIEVTSDDADFDAWSLLNWEENYGSLPDGTFRIRKDITIFNDSNDPEIQPIYVEFTIGGTADKYVTYTLEDITPAGAKLYEHETVDSAFQLVYDGSEGFWLEALQDGRWEHVEPTQYIEPIFRKEKHYIHQLIYPSGYIQLDWSVLYGELPDGTYRIAREVTNTDSTDLRVCTAYVEFTLDNVHTWFDWYSANPDERHPKDTVLDLPGMDGASVSYDNSNNEIHLITADGRETILSSDSMIRNAFLTDLNGDSISEVCATMQTEDSMQVQVYDPVAKKLYELPFGEDWYYVLTQKADRLCVLQYDKYSTVTGYGQVALDSGTLEVQEVDAALEALTDNVVCVDIWTRKQVCLSSGENFHRVLTLLHDLENNVQAATKAELGAVKKDAFYHSHITIAYELGQKTIGFSENFDYVWDTGTDEGYRISNPEPLREFIASVTSGVRDNTVSGEPFASVDTPWDWCAGISTAAAESAQAHVCLYTYSYGNISGSSSTNGWISYDTLEHLTRILNRIPKEAFTPDKTISNKSYHSCFINQSVQNSSVSIIDGVNDIAVIITYRDGKLTMLLTDELEKVRENSLTYLEPTQLWTVEDQSLLDFMVSITNNPPVINYSVGAEYEWQSPLEYKTDGFSLELRLMEGWEYQYVTNPTNSGIRCRPEGITDGWIYFSYWPEEYEPVEEDRYISEGFYYDWKSYVSYAAKDVKSPGGISTYGQVWSYERYDLEKGDYVIINDGADTWFAEYKDRIQDIRSLSNITVE